MRVWRRGATYPVAVELAVDDALLGDNSLVVQACDACAVVADGLVAGLVRKLGKKGWVVRECHSVCLPAL